MSDPSSIPNPPYMLLVPAAFFLLAAAVFVSTGKAWARRWVYRSKEPRWFWWEIVLYSFCGLSFAVIFIVETLNSK